jgi:hypothetical protein
MSQIDYSQPAKQILIDLINQKNGTALLAQDMEFNDPQVSVNNVLKTNTVIKLLPADGSGYFGSRDIHYNRMDIGEILESKPLETQPITQTLLSEFLPVINEAYGTFLKTEDIYDVTIPPYDPLHPNAVREIMLVIRPTSYFYIGEFNLTFGIFNNAIEENDGVTRTYYLLIDGYPINRVRESFIALNVDGTPNTGFGFLGNVSVLNAWSLDKVYPLTNGQFVLEGNFSLSYMDTGNIVLNVTNHTEILIGETGDVISTSSTQRFAFGVNSVVFETPNIPFKYFIDPDNQSHDNHLFRYTDEGVLDRTFTPVIEYQPKLIRVTPTNKLYTVSDVYAGADPNNNGQLTNLIRIDRLLSTGALDTSFNTIYIRSSLPQYNPPAILDLQPIDTQGFYLAFAPTGGLDSSSNIPVVNGQSLLTIDVLAQAVYSWSPVARFEADGELDISFKTSLNGRRGNTLYEPSGSPLSWNTKAIVAEGEKLCLMTYRRNPVTGYDHRQPVQFNISGNEVLLSGQEYKKQYKWTNLLNVIPQSNGLFLGYGTMQSLLNSGNYGSAYSAVGRYKQNGEVDTLIWRSPGPFGTSNPTVISVFLKEHA